MPTHSLQSLGAEGEDLDQASDVGDGAAHEEDLDGGEQDGQHVQLLATELHLCKEDPCSKYHNIHSKTYYMEM